MLHADLAGLHPARRAPAPVRHGDHEPRSHAAFVEAAGVTETDGRMAWMLFRYGHSARPPQALRRELAAMVLPRAGAGS